MLSGTLVQDLLLDVRDILVSIAVSIVRSRVVLLCPLLRVLLLRRRILDIFVLSTVGSSCVLSENDRRLLDRAETRTSLALKSTALLAGLGRSGVFAHYFLKNLVQVGIGAAFRGKAGQSGELLHVGLR